MADKKRLDLWLHEHGYAPSRTHAQDLIAAGQVFQHVGEKKIQLKKASLAVTDDMIITVELGPANRFVSRGGLKIGRAHV